MFWSVTPEPFTVVAQPGVGLALLLLSAEVSFDCFCRQCKFLQLIPAAAMVQGSLTVVTSMAIIIS